MKYLITLTFFLLPVLVLAQPSYIPLVGIPNVGTGENFSFDKFINALYALSISIAALLAVIKIVIAGVKYMLTDIVTSKGEAKKDIYGALLGLLVVLGAVLILTIINPNLVKVNLTFAPMGEATKANTSAPPVLDINLVKEEKLSDGSIVMFLPPNQNSDQIVKFQEMCTGRTSFSFSGGIQCLLPATGKNLIPIESSGFNAEVWCTEQGGVSVKHNLTPSHTWCSLPK